MRKFASASAIRAQTGFTLALLVALFACVPVGAAAPAHPAASSSGTDAESVLAAKLLAAANAYWTDEIRAVGGGSYEPAHLAWFSGSLKQACGATGALSGPFYCPADEQIYLDRAFLGKVEHQSTGSRQLALAYLIGHEIGHHIQLLDGTTTQVQQARGRSSPQLSARLWTTQELQADCFAGLWIRSAAAKGLVKPGKDLDSAMQAVGAVSREEQMHLPAGTVMPDPVASYGTETQRSHWLQTGLSTDRIQECDTFSAAAAGKL